MFQSKQTFASIIKPIQKVIERLEKHVEEQREVIAENDRIIEAADTSSREARGEIAQASSAAEKFKALIGA